MKRFFLLLICSLVVFAPPTWAQDKITPLDCALDLSLQAPLDAKGAQTLYLILTTREPFLCANTELVQMSTVKGSNIAIRVKGTQEPADCQTGFQPAVARIPLQQLGTGLYKIKVTVNRQIFKASLQVAEGHFSLRTEDDPDLFRVLNGRLNLIPSGIIWGEARYEDPALKAVAEKMIAEFIAAGAQLPTLNAGDYGYFYVHYDAAPEEVAVGSGQYALPFYLAYDRPLSSLQAIFDRYKDQLDLELASRTGEQLK